MREEFEQWYLGVVRGHPNNLLKDENGGYKYLGEIYLAWEVATLIECEACAKIAEQFCAKPIHPLNYDVRAQIAEQIRARSNVGIQPSERNEDRLE